MLKINNGIIRRRQRGGIGRLLYFGFDTVSIFIPV